MQPIAGVCEGGQPYSAVRSQSPCVSYFGPPVRLASSDGRRAPQAAAVGSLEDLTALSCQEAKLRARLALTRKELLEAAGELASVEARLQASATAGHPAALKPGSPMVLSVPVVTVSSPRLTVPMSPRCQQLCGATLCSTRAAGVCSAAGIGLGSANWVSSSTALADPSTQSSLLPVAGIPVIPSTAATPRISGTARRAPAPGRCVASVGSVSPPPCLADPVEVIHTVQSTVPMAAHPPNITATAPLLSGAITPCPADLSTPLPRRPWLHNREAGQPALADAGPGGRARSASPGRMLFSGGRRFLTPQPASQLAQMAPEVVAASSFGSRPQRAYPTTRGASSSPTPCLLASKSSPSLPDGGTLAKLGAVGWPDYTVTERCDAMKQATQNLGASVASCSAASWNRARSPSPVARASLSSSPSTASGVVRASSAGPRWVTPAPTRVLTVPSTSVVGPTIIAGPRGHSPGNVCRPSPQGRESQCFSRRLAATPLAGQIATDLLRGPPRSLMHLGWPNSEAQRPAAAVLKSTRWEQARLISQQSSSSTTNTCRAAVLPRSKSAEVMEHAPSSASEAVIGGVDCTAQPQSRPPIPANALSADSADDGAGGANQALLAWAMGEEVTWPAFKQAVRQACATRGEDGGALAEELLEAMRVNVQGRHAQNSGGGIGTGTFSGSPTCRVAPLPPTTEQSNLTNTGGDLSPSVLPGASELTWPHCSEPHPHPVADAFTASISLASTLPAGRGQLADAEESRGCATSVKVSCRRPASLNCSPRPELNEVPEPAEVAAAFAPHAEAEPSAVPHGHSISSGPLSGDCSVSDAHLSEASQSASLRHRPETAHQCAGSLAADANCSGIQTPSSSAESSRNGVVHHSRQLSAILTDPHDESIRPGELDEEIPNHIHPCGMLNLEAPQHRPNAGRSPMPYRSRYVTGAPRSNRSRSAGVVAQPLHRQVSRLTSPRQRAGSTSPTPLSGSRGVGVGIPAPCASCAASATGARTPVARSTASTSRAPSVSGVRRSAMNARGRAVQAAARSLSPKPPQAPAASRASQLPPTASDIVAALASSPCKTEASHPPQPVAAPSASHRQREEARVAGVEVGSEASTGIDDIRVPQAEAEIAANPGVRPVAPQKSKSPLPRAAKSNQIVQRNRPSASPAFRKTGGVPSCRPAAQLAHGARMSASPCRAQKRP